MGIGEVLVSHPTGNANVTAVVDALYESDLLRAFYTCVNWRPDHPLARILPASVRSMLERRARVRIPQQFVHTRPLREMIRSVVVKAGKKRLIAGEDSPFSIESVYADLDKLVARHLPKYSDLKGVYAYEDGALYQFRKARQMGIRCIYDLPIGYWRANREISLEEAELQPDWAGTLNALEGTQAKFERKDEEIELADTILVASSYTRSTLNLYPGPEKNVVVIPYGTPSPVSEPRRLTSINQPLRVLYVGSLTQRKGIGYLFEAVNQLGSAVTLTIIGRKVGKSAALDQACQQHHWIESLSHSKILEQMHNHDVLVFPSLFEGFGLVIGEAMSQGLPVITTSHTGGPDILRDDLDGFIVPIRDSQAIASRLEELNRDREHLAAMSESARQRAGQLSWQGYKDGTTKAVREAIA